MNHKRLNYSALWIAAVADLLFFVSIGVLTVLIFGQGAKNAQLAADIAELEMRQQQFFGSRQDQLRLQETKTLMAKAVVYSDQQVALIDNLEQLAKKAGIEYELNNAVQEDRMKMDAKISGAYANLFNFLKLVENYGYWVSFDGLSLTHGTTQKTTWSGNLILNIPSAK